MSEAETLFVTDAGAVFYVGAGAGERVPLKGMVADGFRVVHLYTKAWFRCGYLADRKGIWFFDGRKKKVSFVTARAEEFRVIDDDYGLDDENLFLEDRLVPGADPASFEWLDWSNSFSRDRHRVYVKSSSHFYTFDEIDAASAVAYDAYVSDLDHVFHQYDGLKWSNDSKQTRPKMAAHLREKHPEVRGWWHPAYDRHGDDAEPIAGPWLATRKAVFFRTDPDNSPLTGCVTLNLVRGADPTTFEPVGDFGRDATRAFYRWRTIPGADPASLRDLGGPFCRDATSVYYNTYRVEAADPATFTVYPDTVSSIALAKDARHVFRNAFERTSRPFGRPDDILKPIPDADAASFALCTSDGSWAVDDRRVYLWGEPSKTIDRASFAFLQRESVDSWARDKTALYNANGRRTIAGVDGASFVALNRFWGHDKDHVFFFGTGRPQKAMEVKTFRVTDEAGGAEDAKYRYRVEKGVISKRKR